MEKFAEKLKVKFDSSELNKQALKVYHDIALTRQHLISDPLSLVTKSY